MQMGTVSALRTGKKDNFAISAPPPVMSSISGYHRQCSSPVTLHCSRLDRAELIAGDTLMKTEHQERSDAFGFALQPKMQSR